MDVYNFVQNHLKVPKFDSANRSEEFQNRSDLVSKISET